MGDCLRAFRLVGRLIVLFAFLFLAACSGDELGNGEEIYVLESAGAVEGDSLSADTVRYWVQSIPLTQLQYDRDYPNQGMVIYEGKLFQCYDKNPRIDVYDLSHRSLLFTIKGDPSGSTHCNNVDFSNIFYAPDDEFPLLFLEVRGTQRRTLVYRIEHAADGYSLRKVQTIRFTGCKGCTTTVDNSDSTLIVYHDADGQNVYSKVRIPDLSRQTATIPLDDASYILARIPVGPARVGQDATVRDGRMYHLFGYANDCELRVTDLAHRREIARVNLPRTGFGGEPEGIAFHRDTLVVTNLYGDGYHLKFTKQPVVK